MPIALDKIEEARRPLEDRIFRFLAGRAGDGQAYSVADIYAGVENVSLDTASLIVAFWLAARASGRSQAPHEHWRAALLELVDQKRLARGDVNGVEYFWAQR